MSRNEIRIDQINRRLGSHGGGSGYGAIHQPFSAAAVEGEADSAILSSGFIATICAIFLLVSSGSYFYAGGQITMPGSETDIGDGEFVSVADQSCLGVWKTDGNNAAAMNCYLSTQPGRFCDVRERKYLTRLFVRYRQDNAVMTAKMSENIKILREKMVKEGSGKAGVFDILKGSGSGSATSLKSMGKGMKNIKKSLNLDGSTMGRQAFDAATERQRKTLADIKKAETSMSSKIMILAEAGYLHRGDFGWMPDAIVKKGFSEAEDTGATPCED
jgi:hypothetical protein